MEHEQEILWRSPHCCEDGIAIPASERVEVHAAPHRVSADRRMSRAGRMRLMLKSKGVASRPSGDLRVCVG
jgi:hypothetical protein